MSGKTHMILGTGRTFCGRRGGFHSALKTTPRPAEVTCDSCRRSLKKWRGL